MHIKVLNDRIEKIKCLIIQICFVEDEKPVKAVPGTMKRNKLLVGALHPLKQFESSIVIVYGIGIPMRDESRDHFLIVLYFQFDRRREQNYTVSGYRIARRESRHMTAAKTASHYIDRQAGMICLDIRQKSLEDFQLVGYGAAITIYAGLPVSGKINRIEGESSFRNICSAPAKTPGIAADERKEYPM